MGSTLRMGEHDIEVAGLEPGNNDFALFHRYATVDYSEAQASFGCALDQ